MEEQDAVLFPLGVVVRVAEYNSKALTLGNVLNTAGNLRKERVGDVRQNKADRIGFFLFQPFGDCVGTLAVSFHQVKDPLPGLLTDVAVPLVDDLGYSGGRNLRQLRNLLHCYRL